MQTRYFNVNSYVRITHSVINSRLPVCSSKQICKTFHIYVVVEFLSNLCYQAVIPWYSFNPTRAKVNWKGILHLQINTHSGLQHKEEISIDFHWDTLIPAVYYTTICRLC